MFFAAYRRAIRERRKVESDRDFWKARALDLEQKLERRSDFFVEREFALVDRFLTSTAKTFAITDEIRGKQKRAIETDATAMAAAWEQFKQDEIEFLTSCAKEAGDPTPEQTAHKDFEKGHGDYRSTFETAYYMQHGR